MVRLLTAVYLLVLFVGSAWGGTPEQPHVLILDSYHPGYEWSDSIVKGIRDSLLKSNRKAIIHVEYMDTKRHPNQNLDKLAQIYIDKYRATGLDLIFSVDDNAFNFIKTYRDQLSAESPLVFCGVNYLTKSKLEGLTNFTGVNETADIEGTISLILKLHPGTSRIISISDMTTTGQIIKRKIDLLRADYANRVKIVHWDELSLAELLARLNQLSDGDVVLFSFFFRDRLGQSFKYDEIAEKVTAAASVPVYGNWDFNLGHGIVGGTLASGVFQGRAAGNCGVRILNGEPASRIPILWKSPNRNMFDEKVLRRFEIRQSSLPTDAIVINHTPTFFEEHENLIITFVAATLTMLVVIVVLVANTRRRIRAEKKLRLSESRYRELVEMLPQPVFEVDIKGRLTYLNQFGLDWLGYSQEDLTAGVFVRDLFFQEDRQQLEENIAKILQGAPLRGNEYRILKKDGTSVPVLSYSRVLHDETGVVGLRGVVTDVSAIHRAEQEALLVRLYLKNVINLMPTILIGTDRDGVVSLWNEQATIILGVSSEAAHGQQLVDILPSLAPEQEKARQAIQDGKLCSETRVRRNLSDGIRYWDIQIYPLTLQDLESAIIIIDDVTEQIQMERVMIQSEKMMSVGGLAAGMAHEINNPLAAILQNIQVISRRLSSGVPQNIPAAEQSGISLEKLGVYLELRRIPAMIEAVIEAGGRVADIIQDMLSFSRSDDSLDTLKDEVDIHDLLAQSLSFARKDHVHYDFKRILIQEEFKEIPLVQCSKSQIQQVLLNIFKNGAEAMTSWDEMTATPKFIIRTCPVDRFVRIEIEDNGPGVPEEVQKHIFEPFFTTKKVGVGTGLGLSISYYIITQNHSGTLDLVSSPGNGCKFIIELPVA